MDLYLSCPQCNNDTFKIRDKKAECTKCGNVIHICEGHKPEHPEHPEPIPPSKPQKYWYR
ncbi:MAG: hypothetical protein R6U44_00145 [Archaeoglobaceae archaeon]